MALNGFTTCRSSDWGTYRIPGTRRSLLVRREIAPLLIGFAAEFHRLVEPIDSGRLDDWGAVCRKVKGRATISFHAGGLAIDLNALRHPMGRRNTFSPNQRRIIAALCKKYGLRWGGTFRRPDDMHVEVIISRPQALALVRRVQSLPTSSVNHPKPVASGKLVVDGDFGPASIRALQRVLGVADDGRFGPGTKRALQRRLGVRADGDFGPQSTKALQRKVGTAADGDWGPNTTRALQRHLNAGGRLG